MTVRFINNYLINDAIVKLNGQLIGGSVSE